MQLEIRPGEGGDDAVAFADELATIIIKTAKRAGLHLTTSHDAGRTTILVGPDAAGPLMNRFAGVHRVQRIPAGTTRRHTSTVTVTSITPAQQRTVTVDADDVVIVAVRSSGPGGQNVNKRSTCVQATHRSTGTTVHVDDHRTFGANRKAALARIAAILTERNRTAANQRENAERFAVAGDASRAAEKSWQWNWQRGTVTEHATGRTYRLADAQRGRLS